MASKIGNAKHGRSGAQQDALKRVSEVAPTSAYAPAVGYSPMRPVGTGKKKRSAGKVIGIFLAVAIVILAIAYAAVALYFSMHFMPDTKLGSLDVSLMTTEQAERAVSEEIQDYSLSISGEGFDVAYSAADMGFDFDAAAVVKAAQDMLSPWRWPVELRQSHDVSAALVATHDQERFEDLLTSEVDVYNQEAVQPTDAVLAYDESAQAFAITPEQIGTALDSQAVCAAASEAIADFQTKLELSEDQLKQPSVFSDDERLIAARDKANGMLAVDFTVTTGDEVLTESSPELIAPWIVLDDELQVSWSSEALSAWASEMSTACNTVGTQRTYTRPDGKTCTVSGGVYGWAVDTDSLVEQVEAALSSGEGGIIELPCSQTADHHAAVGEQDWGDRYADVDLSEQHVYFYDGGKLVWESDCVSGAPDGKNDTPTGVYVINGMESPSTLIGYENGKKTYESKVKYWMPWYENLVGFHDANWQSAFGGTRYADGYGSHGCVNLPTDKAGELYDIIEPGDVVVSHW